MFKVKFYDRDLPANTARERKYIDRVERAKEKVAILLKRNKLVFSHVDKEGFNVYTKV